MKQTFVKACKEFFGLLPGETLMQFAAELKALTQKDKEEFVTEFARLGIEVELAPVAAVA